MRSKNMDKVELKKWLTDNLVYSRGLICKKCNQNWFVKYNYKHIWDLIFKHTNYLNEYSPSIPQRIWHIITDKLHVKCANPSCNNIPTFFSYNKGYLRTCSPSCAQYDPQTINKIQNTNLSKYGSLYALQNKDILDKQKHTIVDKYGVDNISKLDDISDKKKETCLKNYGTEWYLNRQDLKVKHVNDKYGVNNVQQVPSIREKRTSTITDIFYNNLKMGARFNGKVSINFKRNEYIGINNTYSFICQYCLNSFNYYFRGDRIPRCPICYPSVGTSLFEQEIIQYLNQQLPNEIVHRDKTILSNNRELDIYIPTKNIAIECNGLFWHGEVGGNKHKNYHISKTQECESKDIRLIHIFEDEWNDSQDIVKLKLNHILNISNLQSIYARKCKIVDNISLDVKREFLNKTHIQGSCNSKINLGLEYNNEIVSMMTFGPKRIFTNTKSADGEFELLRYSTLYNVIGGAGKLLSYFINTYKPKSIISYADRRWTSINSNVYEKIGFKKLSNGTPNYWYIGRGKNYRRFHRFGFAKHTLQKRLTNFNPDMTEWENMKNNGWDRIWDCGNLKFEMNLI